VSWKTLANDKSEKQQFDGRLKPLDVFTSTGDCLQKCYYAKRSRTKCKQIGRIRPRCIELQLLGVSWLLHVFNYICKKYLRSRQTLQLPHYRYQARNQLGTLGEGKSFLRRAQNFWTISNTFKLYPTHFSRRGEKFSKGGASPLGYGPDWWYCICVLYFPTQSNTLHYEKT